LDSSITKNTNYWKKRKIILEEGEEEKTAEKKTRLMKTQVRKTAQTKEKNKGEG